MLLCLTYVSERTIPILICGNKDFSSYVAVCVTLLEIFIMHHHATEFAGETSRIVPLKVVYCEPAIRTLPCGLELVVKVLPAQDTWHGSYQPTAPVRPRAERY